MEQIIGWTLGIFFMFASLMSILFVILTTLDVIDNVFDFLSDSVARLKRPNSPRKRLKRIRAAASDLGRCDVEQRDGRAAALKLDLGELSDQEHAAFILAYENAVTEAEAQAAREARQTRTREVRSDHLNEIRQTTHQRQQNERSRGSAKLLDNWQDDYDHASATALSAPITPNTPTNANGGKG